MTIKGCLAHQTILPDCACPLYIRPPPIPKPDIPPPAIWQEWSEVFAALKISVLGKRGEEHQPRGQKMEDRGDWKRQVKCYGVVRWI